MKKIIFFQAHPDDLEFNSFHLLTHLSKKRENEYEIKIGSFTRGEYGWPKHAPHFAGERLGKLRTKELYKAMSTYGINPERVHFFEIIDGCVKFDRKTIELVKKYIEKEKPDIIFACEPRNTYYRHPDHMNVGKTVYYILDKNLANLEPNHPKLYFFNSINPNFFWPFKKSDIPHAKMNMYVHKSQMHIWNSIGRTYRLITRIYGKKIEGWKYAEGYRRVYYGKESGKTKEMNFKQKLFLTLNVKIWPEKVTKHQKSGNY